MQQTNQEDYMTRPTRMHETATIISLLLNKLWGQLSHTNISFASRNSITTHLGHPSLMCGQTA